MSEGRPGLRARLFASRSSTLSSSVEMAFFTVFNALVNFTKSVVVAGRYGATSTSDAYYASVNLLQTPAALLSDSMTALVLPRYQAHERDGSERVFLSSYLAFVGIAFAALGLAFALFGRALSSLILRGFSGDTLDVVERLILISIPAIILSPLTVLLDNALRARKFLIFGNLGGAANSIVSLALLFFLARSGVSSVVVAALAGAVVNFGVVIYAAIRKRQLGGGLDLRLGLKEAKLALPLLVGGVFGVASSYAEKYFASFLDSGTTTLLNMSASLVGIARGILVGALISVYYPFISEAVVAKDDARYAELVGRAKRLAIGLFGLGTTCMIAFSRPLFMLVYGHGRFDGAAVTSLARLFGVASIGVVYAALASVGTYSFYALGDPKKPVASSVATSTLGGVGLQAVLVGPFGAGGLVAALVLANAANLCLDYWLLYRHHRRSILAGRDALPLLALLAGCLLSGTRDWSPWYLLAPPLYWYFVSYRIYGLDPRRLRELARERGAGSASGGKAS